MLIDFVHSSSFSEQFSSFSVWIYYSESMYIKERSNCVERQRQRGNGHGKDEAAVFAQRFYITLRNELYTLNAHNTFLLWRVL